MFYNFKVNALKFLKQPFIKTILCKSLNIETGDDIRKELIKNNVPKKSFVDIGSMWRVNGLFSFFAEECGATQVVSVDIIESEDFWNEKNKRNSSVTFIKGDIHNKEVVEKIGLCDVVFCSGVLYHSPNPLLLLEHLRKICKETLILVTMVIPEISGVKNSAVFYPCLDKKQKNLWNLSVVQKGINEPYERGDKYANWFWGFSPSCVASMLKYSDFEIEYKIIRPFQAFYVCKTRQRL